MKTLNFCGFFLANDVQRRLTHRFSSKNKLLYLSLVEVATPARRKLKSALFRAHLWRNTEMKYLRILFVFGLVLFCGSVASHASTFHGGGLDPSCNNGSTPPNTECGIGFTDIGTPIPVNFSAAQCASTAINPVLTGLPKDPTTYGCFFGTNDTGAALLSITLDLASIPGVTGCDNDLEGLNYGPAFTNSTCTLLAPPPTDPSADNGGFQLTFFGGPGVPDGHTFILIEEGLNPDLFTGSTTIETTPEPDSLLLLSTGTMMMGLYFAGRQRLFSFRRK
jgi:hypothetical protein